MALLEYGGATPFSGPLTALSRFSHSAQWTLASGIFPEKCLAAYQTAELLHVM
jgi:hypothetical protein